MDAGARLTSALRLRTAKSCGPDASTLASSCREASFSGRRWQQSPITGESTKETVKTIACGNAGCPGATVVTNARAYYSTRAAAGATGTRHSPRPLFSGESSCTTSGASRRGNAKCMSLAVIASEAKQSTLAFLLPHGLLTWGMRMSRMRSHLFVRLRPPLRPDRGLFRMTRADQVKAGPSGPPRSGWALS